MCMTMIMVSTGKGEHAQAGSQHLMTNSIHPKGGQQLREGEGVLKVWSWQPGWGSTCGVVQPGPPPLSPWRGGAPWTAWPCGGEGVASMSQQGEAWENEGGPSAETDTESLQ